MRARLLIPVLLALAVPAAAQAPDVRQIDKEVERLRRELVQLGRDEQSGEGLAERQRAQLMELNAREAAVKARIDANRDSLAKLLAALQTYQRRPPPPLLVNPRSARDAVRAAILIKAITPELQARGRAFAVQADAIARLRRAAAAASETLFQAESDIADHRADIDRLLAEKRSLEQGLYPGDDPQTSALAARAGSVEAFVQGLAAAKGSPPVQPPPRFGLPVQGVLIRRFGQGGGPDERRQGWTWRTIAGASVLSPAAARVDYAGPLKGWGPVVILNVGANRRLVLAGMQEVVVGQGRAVAPGEPIGRMGPARKAAFGQKVGAGPELYLEVRDGEAAVNPARWLTANAQNPPNSSANQAQKTR